MIPVKFVCSLALFFLLSVSLLAQTGTLTGQVADETGAVVPKAKVTLAGPGGSVKATTSGGNGTY
jgi:hypothetical protein